MPEIAGNAGHRKWSMTRDEDGHRNYQIVFRVKATTPGRDGPYRALFYTPGLPTPGDPWIMDNDADLYAHCTKYVTVEPVTTDRVKSGFFDLTFRFTTRPQSECQDSQIDDPLLEPQKVSGSSIKYSEEAIYDRFGRPLLTSSFEQLRGPQVEFDNGRDQIRISQNVPLLQHALCTSMRDCVNAFTLWGYPPRCVKLSDFNFERVFVGTCQVYYKRHFTFDISYRFNPVTGSVESGFDRNLLDEGTKALNGHFDKTTGEYVLDDIAGSPPNANNPMHFKRFQDRQGNVARVILNGAGLPASVVVAGTGNFVSIVGSNTGNDLNNTSKWIPLLSDDPEEYYSYKQYLIGSLVLVTDAPDPSDNGVYIAVANSLNNYPPDTPSNWIFLPSLTDSGQYNASTTYDLGDYVIDSQNTAVGRLRVEKYHEADFLLLNIPIFF